MQMFRVIIQKTQEIYVDSSSAADQREFLRLGLTDSATLHTSLQHAVIVTSDLDLFLAASSQDSNRAINFNHVRESRGVT